MKCGSSHCDVQVHDEDETMTSPGRRTRHSALSLFWAVVGVEVMNGKEKWEDDVVVRWRYYHD
jgi:hypothetical protein